MGTIRHFEDLKVWQKSRLLCQLIHQYCLKNHLFQIHDKSQIDRASASIMDNIAEGFEREGNKEFIHFLAIAKGSSAEVRSQLIRAFDRNYLNKEIFEILKNETLELSKMLSKFIIYLKQTSHKGNKFS